MKDLKFTIDLKFNLKNFSGVLTDGRKYRVFFATTPVENTNLFKLELIVKTLDDSTSNDWLYNFKLSVSDYYKKEDYKQCLRNCLLALEENLNVQLLKSKMSIAI